jgi:hypothetical protein
MVMFTETVDEQGSTDNHVQATTRNSPNSPTDRET